jgi:hypothetical protein
MVLTGSSFSDGTSLELACGNNFTWSQLTGLNLTLVRNKEHSRICLTKSRAKISDATW